MTTVDNPANVIFDDGGSNEITIETTHVEEIKTKILRLIKTPRSKDSRVGGPIATKVLDLLRVEHRFNIRGKLDKSDKSKLEALFDQGGPFSMTWDGITSSANMEKYSYVKKENENSERDVVITIVIGGDL